jgi:hypothetical protein
MRYGPSLHEGRTHGTTADQDPRDAKDRLQMKTIPIQRRMGVMRPDPEGGCAIRESHRAERKRGTGTISPRCLLRCGCCDGALQIHYGPDGMEINGVYGSIENWREILLPLLRMSRRGKHFTADVIQRKMPKSISKGVLDPGEKLTPAEAKLVRRGEAQLKVGQSKPWRTVKNARSL